MSNTPPHNQDAEENVLGAMMLSPNAIEDAIETGLAYTDFYRESHGLIYRQIARLYDQGHPVDLITVAHSLDKAGLIQQVGGQARLAELGALVPATSNVEHWARIVKETSTLRSLISAGMEITRLGKEGGEIDELIAQAEEMLTRVTSHSAPDDFASVADGLDTLVAEIEEAIENETPRLGLLTGFDDLDTILTGLHPGQLLLLAARPSMGKSALAQNIAENIADRGVTAALASLEMSREEVQLRAVARAARIPSTKLKTGAIPLTDLPMLRLARDKVRARAPFFFVEDSPAVTLPQIRAKAKRLKRQNGLALLVVDYLQLLLGSNREDNRQAEIAQISRGLKVLARELHIPILALSQLNRNLESRTEKRPMLSDLRDSGALEQDADVVLFVYRDDYYNPMSENAGIAEVIVAKNRNGATQQTVKLTFSRLYTSFGSINPLKEVA